MKPANVMHEIDIAITDPAWNAVCPGAEALVRRAAMATLQMLQPATACEISIVLADDAQLQELNRNWRKIDKPTNVLSFPAEEDAQLGAGPRMLGDVIVACATVEREAKASGITVGDHLSHLIVHGILHLLGYDHEVEAGAVIMEAREIEIMSGLGISNPYTEEAMP